MHTYIPRHRDMIRPTDSYSAAVDHYRAPRHLDYSAPVVELDTVRSDVA